MSRLRAFREDIAAAVTELLGIPCGVDVEGDPLPDTAVVRPGEGVWLSRPEGTFCDVEVTVEVMLLANGSEFRAAQEQLEEWTVELFSELFKQPLTEIGGTCPPVATASAPMTVGENSTLLAKVLTLTPFTTRLKD